MYSVLLYHHLGLGDQILCHGIVREYCRKYDTVTILASPDTYSSVAFMYRDLKNLTIVKCSHLDAPAYLADHTSEYTETRIIGFERLEKQSGVRLEKQFYTLAGVDMDKKWDSFHVERDPVREEALYKKVAPEGEFIFLHEDPKREYLIDRNKISDKSPIVTPDPSLTDNVFDYCMIIEKAKEIHVIDSSFMFLIDCLPYDAPGQILVVHRYARLNPKWKLPVLKKKWVILETSIPTKIVNFVKHRLPFFSKQQ